MLLRPIKDTTDTAYFRDVILNAWDEYDARPQETEADGFKWAKEPTGVVRAIDVSTPDPGEPEYVSRETAYGRTVDYPFALKVF